MSLKNGTDKVKNRYLKNLEKIEFVVTYACTGRCKHCSEGDHKASGTHIDPSIAADAVRRVAAKFDIKTVMAFGGEPLIYPEAVYSVMSAARELEIPRRQVITNGCFSNDNERIRNVAISLAACGVNDLLLSVDAFHQETIPIDTVRYFAGCAIGAGVPMRLQPAWLVSRDHDNPYNEKTREILDAFSDMAISTSSGNVIFPEGNAIKYLSEYLDKSSTENPYTEDPCNVKCISIEPCGNVFDGNIYSDDIMDILESYSPKQPK